jgi:hypothetical protein
MEKLNYKYLEQNLKLYSYLLERWKTDNYDEKNGECVLYIGKKKIPLIKKHLKMFKLDTSCKTHILVKNISASEFDKIITQTADIIFNNFNQKIAA